MATKPLVSVRQALVSGFWMGLAVWVSWFVTHLPWVGLRERAALGIVLATWLATGIACAAGSRSGLLAGSIAGLVSSAAGLLLVGTRLRDVPASGAGPAGDLVPSAPLIVLGFVVVGVAMGLAGALVARAIPIAPAADGDDPRLDAARRFSRVTIGATIPLLLVGGLVTSTNAGMAVVDWPNTFGSNMFLYPLGPRAQAPVFLEHSHRLFGTLLGLCAIVALVLTLASPATRWAKGWAVGLLALVVVQGLLGAMRVLRGSTDQARDDRLSATIHGVLGQVVLVAAVGLACYLSRSYREGPAPALLGERHGPARRVRFFATLTLHATLVQLIFGAMYRHYRSSHALWSHAGFAMIVLVAAVLAGFAASGLRGPGDNADAVRESRFARTLARLGQGLVACVVLQFLLGWLSFFSGGAARVPKDIGETLIRSAHHANGAIMVALAAGMAFVVRRIPKRAIAAA